ncbi:hypothetical protein Fcan01_17373 [Folsomia candida]|uniref:Uncharacterized protein n=1 Tax=Folsomia candida TaxID=158441 RepID=A0A226DRI7_FOLCA|nr:hypothetical protein Fcan01_17373 [Folsomia candida]
MNLHPIKFFPGQNRKFFTTPCSLKHCWLYTPHTTCPVSELMFRLNFTTKNVLQNSIGLVATPAISRWGRVEEFWMPELLYRLTWIKHFMEFKKVTYTIYALPTELNAKSMLKIFDVLSFSILIFLGGCSSLVIYKNRTFVFVPFMWTISIFLQQGTNIVVKPVEAKVTRLRVFMAYGIFLIWLFNAFYVGSIFSGEFFSLFTTNRVPQLPNNLKELLESKHFPIISFSDISVEYYDRKKNTKVSYVKEVMVPQMFHGGEYAPGYRKMLNDLKEKVEWLDGLNQFRFARGASLNKEFYFNQTKNRPSIFAVIDPPSKHQVLEKSFGVFKKYFIIYNNEEYLDAMLMPWVTSRNPFGEKFENNIGYLAEAGMLDYWEKTFQIQGVNKVRSHFSCKKVKASIKKNYP